MRPASAEQVLRFFFRASGRISRIEYALGFIVIQAINFAVLSEVIARDTITPPALLFIIVISVPLVVGLAVIMVKRCHDIGLPGSFFLLALVPFVGIVWPIALVFLPGNPGANGYGQPPRFLPD